MRLVRCLALVIAALLVPAASLQAAVTLFQDNFSSGSLDPSRWIVIQDPPANKVAVVGGEMVATYIGDNTAPRFALARSVPIALPAGWTAVTLSGDWRYIHGITGEFIASMFGENEMATRFVQGGYVAGGGPLFAKRDSTGLNQSLARNWPTQFVPFEMTITPTGWSFKENGATLANETTTHMAGIQSLQFQIGGWDFSPYYNEARFDNIRLDVVPEPATLLLVGAGLVGGAAARRRK